MGFSSDHQASLEVEAAQGFNAWIFLFIYQKKIKMFASFISDSQEIQFIILRKHRLF